MQESIKINGMFRHRITSTVHHLTDISSVEHVHMLVSAKTYQL